MRKSKILFLSILSMLIIVSSCKKDDPVNEAEVLVKYIEASITPKTIPSYITAAALSDAILTNSVYMIDVRSADHYAIGHIDGAVNVPLADLLTHVEANSAAIGTKDIVVICYSGQSAAWGTSLLRVAGYTQAKSLKFGMSSWHQDLDSWTNNVSDNFATQFVTTSTAMGPEGDLPNLSTGFDNGEEILQARLEAMFTEGFGAAGVSATEVFANKDNWYIINYWPPAHYDGGHIPNAIMYDPNEDPLTLAKYLETLPGAADKTIVVYCYTGQTSAYMAAYLRLLGYNAKTLKFGANSMIHSTMPSSKWVPLTENDNRALVGTGYVTK